jgi:Big-like domain-containing protein
MKQFALSPPAAVALLLGLAGCGGDLTLPASTPTGLSLAVLDGDRQTGTVGQPLQNPVVVEVKTGAGAPMPDRQVVFVATGSGAGTFDPDTALTDAQGKALTHWVLGTAPGTYTAEARIVPQDDSAPPVAFQAAAVAGAPDSVRADSPLIQSGFRGQPVDQSLVVLVVDRYGNPVPGVEVKWKADNGNGELSPADGTVTGADGRSGVIWTLGNRIGIQQATAEVKDLIGSPVTFSATVLF